MTSKNLADYGIYPRRSVAKQIVNASKDASCRQAAISVLLPEGARMNKFTLKKEPKTFEGIGTGAGAGMVVGAALGWLVSIGSLALPGVGPFIATIDPIMVALGGASCGGLFGAIAGALITMGILQHEENCSMVKGARQGIFIPAQTDENHWKFISHR